MASDLDVDRLRLLREVGLRGSIAGAARAVGLTASAVSQQVAQLEREAGAALLERSSRGVALTGTGQLLADRAGQVLDVLAAARADLDRIAGAVAGEVRIAAVASAAATLVSSALRTVRDTLPAVRCSVVAAEPDRAIGLLLTGDVELAVVDEYDRVPIALPDTAVVRELGRDPLVVVRPAGWDGGGRVDGGAGSSAAPVELASLAGQAWVMPPEDAACGRAVRAACRAAGFEPRVRWETDDMLLLVRAVADGHGVAVLPRLAVPGAAAGAEVASVLAAEFAAVAVTPLRSPEPVRRLLAVARTGVTRRPAVAAVLEALAARNSSNPA